MTLVENVISDLFEIANDYTLKSNMLHYNDIFDCLFLVNKNKYFKHLMISSEIPESGALADFSMRTQTIIVYVDAISKKLESELSNSQNRELVIALIYNELLRCILHEIEHSKQYTLKDAVLKKSLEKSLMEYSLVNDRYEDLAYSLLDKEGRTPTITNMQEKIWLLTVLWGEFYTTNYSILPFERLAEIRAYSLLESIYRSKPKYKFYESFANICKLKSILEGYKIEGGIVLAPTTVFIQKFNETIFGGSIPFDWYSSNPERCLDNVSQLYDFKKRIIMGLPVTIDEFKHAIKVFHKKEDEFDSKCEQKGIFVKKL